MNEDQAIAEAETRRKHAALNGNEPLEAYWAERVLRLAEQRDTILRRMCAPASFYETPSHA